MLPEFDAPAHASRGWEWGSEAGKGDLVKQEDLQCDVCVLIPIVKGKVVCVDQNWMKVSEEPNSGQLNPLNPAVYEVQVQARFSCLSAVHSGPIRKTQMLFQVLEDLYKDLLLAFSTDDQKVPLFHMGGDEVNFGCWRTNEDIMAWIKEKRHPPEVPCSAKYLTVSAANPAA